MLFVYAGRSCSVTTFSNFRFPPFANTLANSTTNLITPVLKFILLATIYTLHFTLYSIHPSFNRSITIFYYSNLIFHFYLLTTIIFIILSTSLILLFTILVLSHFNQKFITILLINLCQFFILYFFHITPIFLILTIFDYFDSFQNL